jgi:hypothetical protein
MSNEETTAVKQPMPLPEATMIYNLGLHQECRLGSVCVIRVPGGWIYRFWDFERQEDMQPIFIPYNNEFQKS